MRMPSNFRKWAYPTYLFLASLTTGALVIVEAVVSDWINVMVWALVFGMFLWLYMRECVKEAAWEDFVARGEYLQELLEKGNDEDDRTT